MNLHTIPEPFFSLHVRMMMEAPLTPNQKHVLFNLTLSEEYNDVLGTIDLTALGATAIKARMNFLDKIVKSESHKHSYSEKEVGILEQLALELLLVYQSALTRTKPIDESGDHDIEDIELEYLTDPVDCGFTNVDTESLYTQQLSSEAYQKVLDIIQLDLTSEAPKNHTVLVGGNFVSRKQIKKFVDDKWGDLPPGDLSENASLCEKMLIVHLYNKYEKEKGNNPDVKSVWKEVQAELAEEYGITKKVSAISNAQRSIWNK